MTSATTWTTEVPERDGRPDPFSTDNSTEKPMKTVNAISASVQARETLQEGREAKGLTQTEAAKLLGVTQAEWSRWETGGRGLTLDRLDSIAEALGLTIHISLSEPPKKLKPRAPSKRRRS